MTKQVSTIDVFYHEDQLHDACSFSKSPLKPGLMARRIGPDPAFEFKSSLIHAVGGDRLALTHDRDHVQGLIDGSKADGFGNKSKKDNRAIRTTVGNYLAAAEWVAAGMAPVAWSLTSGFHHAGYDECEGFCTFNALNLAAVELWKYRGMKTLIVDGDAHFGNGCVDIIDRCEQAAYLRYIQMGVDHGGGWDEVIYRRGLEAAIATHRPGVIMYQAGADAWVGDPLNCGGLTIGELYQRDIITLHVAKQLEIPIVVNLAGGYAENYEDTLRIHQNTGEALKEVFLGRGCAVIPEGEQ